MSAVRSRASAVYARGAGLLAALAAAVALSCGSDTIDLLPLSASPGSSAASGSGGISSSGSTGTETSGGGGSGGSGALDNGASGTTAGTSTSAGAGGGSKPGNGGRNGCSGPGCGAGGGSGTGTATGGSGGNGGDAAFGGTLNFPCEVNGTVPCQACTSDDQCPSRQHCFHNLCAECWIDDQCPNGVCDKVVHRCAPICQSTLECRGGRVCDPAYNACVSCTSNGEGCPNSGSEQDAHICYFRRCVECVTDDNCTGDRKNCLGYHCVCLTDKECGEGMRCDRASGHCQPQ